MTTLEIPHEEWSVFFDPLGCMHTDERIRVEQVRMKILRGPSGDDRPLEIEAGDGSTGLVYSKGRESGRSDRPDADDEPSP